MKKILPILEKIQMIAKYGAVVVAGIKAIELFIDEVKKIEFETVEKKPIDEKLS